MWKYKLLATAALAIAGAQASAADNIACMDGALVGEHKSMFDDYFKNFRMDKLAAEGPPPALLAIITERAGLCAEQYRWSPDAIEQANFYVMGLLINKGLEAQTTFTPAQWQRLKQVYATTDQSRLRRVLQPVLDGVLAGEGDDVRATEADEIYFGRMMLKTGLPMTQKNAEFVGNWMASRVMMDVFSGRFAKY